MLISELKTGMIVHFTSGSKGIVLLDTPEGDIVAGDTWFPIKEAGGPDIQNWDSGHKVEKILQPNSNFDYGDLRVHELNSKVLYRECPTRVIVENAGSSKRSIYIERKNPEIIHIGCFSGTRLEAIDAIMDKYSNPAAALAYIKKVNLCFKLLKDAK